MERSAMNALEKWKNDPKRKPLVIMGARQVGKTWLMKEFGKRFFPRVAYISFYNNKRMAAVFDNDFDTARIFSYLSIEVGFTIDTDTLIIFDEIQNAPKAFESLKYFCEEARQYHIVAAGSLLGVALHEGISYPVGKVDLLYLYPLNFREYLQAVGEQSLAETLLTGDYSQIDAFSDRYIYHLKNYFYVGGMPEAVDRFRMESDYFAARRIQKDILTQYKGDFSKHIETKDIPRVNMVWESIPMQLAKENKKFFFGKIKNGARSKEFEAAIEWLLDCGLVYKVHRVNEPHVPLSAYKDFSAYKIFMIDIGLLGAMSELDAKSLLDGNDLFVEFKGALTEQYVLQELISSTDYTPYYFGTDSARFEQDFMIQQGMNVVPIEVKAAVTVHSQSLKAFHEKYHPEKSIRFSLQKYKEQEWMVNIPLYAVCNC